jgi:hypothetical protein
MHSALPDVLDSMHPTSRLPSKATAFAGIEEEELDEAWDLNVTAGAPTKS